MFTNTQIIDSLAQVMNDAVFQTRSQATFAQTLTEAQNFLTEQLEALRKVDSTSIVLVAGTQEYTLPSSFIKFPTDDNDIEDGVVSAGDDADVPVIATTVPLLNSKDSGWRGATAAAPEKFYIIKSAILKIGFHPKPSSTFIATYGSTVYLDHIYRPADIAYDSNSPFDSAPALAGLHYLLKLHALWQMKLEDKAFADADRYEKKLMERLPAHFDMLSSMTSAPGQHGFRTDFGGAT